MGIATKEDIKNLLKLKKRIAVVGLSDQPFRTSYMVSEYMQKAGYEIIPINPNVNEVLGQKAYAKLEDIEGQVDIVNVFRRSEYLPEVARSAANIKAGFFWAQLGLYNAEAEEILQSATIPYIMDKCIKVEHAMIR
ncbi:CoA-binding protein [Fictibacillus phosphorivorans]|uniref:CoA-binding protein n=1 Tax=Fictibacillus phosphorivorans TaxID=1221500 RepID=UPI00203B45BF|nr:CoA-binding protein [Fictibacillus phosphorivorans]MCM3718862.1 CoA-binding protein [Fictibacillus phosphorivorans]MCM3776484.1 CoA-binding protein [Fictibacillus phosphorivorans]